MTAQVLTLADFAAEVAPLARGGDAASAARAAAQRLPQLLANRSLLTAEQRRADHEGYAQHLLHVDPEGRFSVVALVWQPGQSTPVHDHVAWCVVGVYEGEELETRYRVEAGGGGPRPVPTGAERHLRGEVVWLLPDGEGDLHRVSNPTDRTAISIHVYGADIARLGTSIRTRYPLPEEGV